MARLMATEFDEEYYQEYKLLGGKKSKREYFKNLDIFLEETLDVFTGGDIDKPEKYESREDSMYAVSEIANIPMREVNRIFKSVDRITAYT
jgi:hypothetical protein